jgi:hypothetical protein
MNEAPSIEVLAEDGRVCCEGFDKIKDVEAIFGWVCIPCFRYITGTSGEGSEPLDWWRTMDKNERTYSMLVASLK